AGRRAGSQPHRARPARARRQHRRDAVLVDRRARRRHGARPGPGDAGMIAAATLVEALSRGLPGDRLVVDPDVLAAISHDEAEWAQAGKAVAGVRARSEAEVQHVVRTCAELGAPVVPRGAGTGLSGGANAVSGSVILDLSRMNQVLAIDADNLMCVVLPGAVINVVMAVVDEHDMWFPTYSYSVARSTCS